MTQGEPFIRLLRQLQTMASMAGLGADPDKDADRLLHVAELPDTYWSVAALALHMRRRPTVHVLSPGVAELVAETDLHDLPEEPPRLLRSPWILQASRGFTLWEHFVVLAGFPENEREMWLLVWRGETGDDFPDVLLASRWRQSWGERLSVKQLPEDFKAELERLSKAPDDGVVNRWMLQAVRFAVVFGLLLEADLAPVWVDTPDTVRRREKRSPGRGRERSLPEWITRTVYIAGSRRRVPAEPIEHDEARRSGRPERHQQDVQDREPAIVPVRGFLRRQPYGPGGKLRKWIYVKSYEARRWIVPERPRRIVVRKLGGTGQGAS